MNQFDKLKSHFVFYFQFIIHEPMILEDKLYQLKHLRRKFIVSMQA